jgi:hypothetical protein
MLNTTNIKMGSHTSNVTFNATSNGMMQRSNPKSFFLRFHKTSPMAGYIFPTDGTTPYVKRGYNGSDKIQISVLQIIVFGDDEFLCEAIELADLKEQ